MTNPTIIKSLEVNDALERHRGKQAVEKIHKKIFSLYQKNASKADKFKWLLEKTLWLFIYLSGIVLVALTAFDLYHQYMMNPTSFKVTLEQSQKMKLQDMTICLPFEPDKIFRRLQYDWYPTGLRPGEYLEELDPAVDKTQLQDALERFFASDRSWRQIESDTWPILSLYYAHKYLVMISNAERNEEWDRNGRDFLPNSSDPLWTTLMENMVKLNVNIGQFRATFGRKFRDLFPMTAHFIISTNYSQNASYSEKTTTEINSDELVYIRTNQLCYRLKLDDVKFGSTDYIRLTIDRKNLEIDRDTYYSGYFYISGHYPVYGLPVTIDFSGEAKLGSVSASIASAYFGASSVLTVTPLMQYTSLRTIQGKYMCSAISSTEACQSECRNKLIRDACKCSAAMLPFLSFSSSVECSFNIYDRCLNFSGQVDKMCVDNCLKPCTYWKYMTAIDAFQRVNMDYDMNNERNVAAIDILVGTFNFLLHEEVFNFDVKDIVGVMGGAIGFWLGVDVIVIAHYVILKPVIFLIEKYFQRKTPRTKSASSHSAPREDVSTRRNVRTTENDTERQT